MIILHRVSTQTGILVPIGININNLIGCSYSEKDNRVWVVYWDGADTAKVSVTESVEQIQSAMLKARRG